MNPIFAGLQTSVFEVMSGLARDTGAVNLGQGSPDSDGPAPVLAEAVRAIQAGINQYLPLFGAPVLRRAITEHQERFYGLTLDPDSEVLVTAGAVAVVMPCPGRRGRRPGAPAPARSAPRARRGPPPAPRGWSPPSPARRRCTAPPRRPLRSLGGGPRACHGLRARRTLTAAGCGRRRMVLASRSFRRDHRGLDPGAVLVVVNALRVASTRPVAGPAGIDVACARHGSPVRDGRRGDERPRGC